MKSRIEVMSIFAISLAVLLLFFMLNLVSAEQPSLVSASLPSGHACYDEPGFKVYIKGLPGCNNIDCSKCGTAIGDSCTGTPAPTYYDCNTGEWDCNLLNVDNIDPEEDFECKTSGKYVGVYMGKSSTTTLVPVENIKGYYVTYPDACIQGARFFERWDTDFNKCVELVDGKEIYHGFLIGTRCSTDTEIVSTSATEFGQTAIKYQRCSGWCPPPHVFSCTDPGSPVTETGCQDPGEVCYKGWNDTNKNGDSEETKGICDYDGKCKKLNLSIESVEPVQVLSGFNWVQNKEGVVRVKVRMTNPLEPEDIFGGEPKGVYLNPNPRRYKENVKVRLSLWKKEFDPFEPYDPHWVIQWTKRKSQDVTRSFVLQEIKFGDDSINFFDVAIPKTGVYKFVAEVDPDDNYFEINENDNKQESSEFSVFKTIAGRNKNEYGNLKIIYFPVKIGSFRNNFDKRNFETFVDQQHKFLKDVYPIDPDKLKKEIEYKLSDAISPSVNVPDLPVLRDAYIAALYAQICNEAAIYHSDYAAEIDDVKLIAVIPKEYASFFGRFSGLRIGSCNAAIISYSSTYKTTAHEVGHMYGLPASGGEEYNTNPVVGNALQVDGWRESLTVAGATINLDKNRGRNDVYEDLKEIYSYTDENGQPHTILLVWDRWFCMMGGGSGGAAEDIHAFWIDHEDYYKLMEKLK